MSSLRFDPPAGGGLSEQTLHAVAGVFPHVVWRADAGGAVDFVSGRWLEQTGTAPAALLSRGWLERLHPDDVAPTQRAWERALRTRSPHEAEHRFLHADGTYHWYLARGIPLCDEHGTVLAWHGTLTNIDQTKRSELALRLILKADALFASSLEVRGVYEQLVKIVVPELADWAVVYTLEADTVTVAAFAHAHGIARDVAGALRGIDAARISGDGPLVTVLRRGEPAMLEDSDWLDTLAPSVARPLRALGSRSAILVPIIHRRRMLGALSAHAVAGSRELDERDLAVLAELAARAGSSVNNAQNYQSQVRVADLFQRATLPAELPRAGAVSFSAVYEAGRSEALVGGDWYDAFALPGGSFVISIGDVAGSGLPAAVTMGAVRRSLRALSHVLADPGEILDSADRMLRSEENDRIVTAVVAIYDPRTQMLRFASAGHPPPLLLQDGSVRELIARGLPLGLRHHRPGETRDVRLEAGALLVLYTDGLTEATRDILAGERALHAALVQPGLAERSDPSAAIRSAVLPGGANDDVAILTMRVHAAQAGAPCG